MPRLLLMLLSLLRPEMAFLLRYWLHRIGLILFLITTAVSILYSGFLFMLLLCIAICFVVADNR